MRKPGETELKTFDPSRTQCAPGTSVMVATAGGGGWGDPLERPASAVQNDVLEELVTQQSARDIYGVVLDASNAIDESATRTRRAHLRAQREAKPK